MIEILARKVFVSLLKRPFLLALIFCVGCSAQSYSPETSKRIERQLRSNFNVPESVKITVSEPKPSTEFQGMSALSVTFESGERKSTQEFLLSKDGKTLYRLGKIDVSQEAYERTVKKDEDAKLKQMEMMKKIDIVTRPYRGNKDAKVTMIVYDDFQCPYCAQMYRTLFNDVAKNYSDSVRIVFKDFPLIQIHPWAKRAAIDSNCLAEQSNDAYWDFADYVHNNQGAIAPTRDTQAANANLDKAALESGKRHGADSSILQACLKSQPDAALNASIKEAEGLEVEATPTMFIGGKRLEGAIDASELSATLDAALRDAGQPVPSKPVTNANNNNSPVSPANPAAPAKDSSPSSVTNSKK
jgi:protein-disulfide isomerase